MEELPSLHHNYGYYRFTIEDNGFGMSEEFQQKLFEPFERSQDPRVESMEGTGLGMPITRNLVQLMQGDIEVESQLDKGSKFTITLFLSLQEGTGQGPLEAQEEGKEPVSLEPGMVITIPAEVKHWHGAKADSWFSHIAVEVPGEETSNEWCEPVDDEAYDQLGN